VRQEAVFVLNFCSLGFLRVFFTRVARPAERNGTKNGAKMARNDDALQDTCLRPTRPRRCAAVAGTTAADGDSWLVQASATRRLLRLVGVTIQGMSPSIRITIPLCTRITGGNIFQGDFLGCLALLFPLFRFALYTLEL
jgi:hypothetical protein